MRDPPRRTKVVLRHLPPSIPPQAVMDQIDGRFAGHYDWACFRPGKNSHKNCRYSRVYLNFLSPEDVLEFAEIFNGHTFVNEKGAQFKAVVEYAPSQLVPKSNTKKDGREGTILKDPDYLKFLEHISKPVEHLPSAEVQLERKESERAAGGKEPLVITPLMAFVRQQRAAKSVSQRSGNNKLGRKGVDSFASPGPNKRASDRRRSSNSTYVVKDSTIDGNVREKPTYILASRREEQQVKDKNVNAASSNAVESAESDINASTGGLSASPLGIEGRKEKIVLLRGRARIDQTAMLASPKHDPRVEHGGRNVRSTLSSKDPRQSPSGTLSEQEAQMASFEKERRPPRPPNIRAIVNSQMADNDSKGHFEERGGAMGMHQNSSSVERVDRHTRSKERPERAIWTPRHSDRSHGGGNLSSDGVQVQKPYTDQVTGRGDRKSDIPSGRREDAKGHGIRPAENGSNRHSNRRAPGRGMKEMDGSPGTSEGKPPRRGSGYNTHDRQVWVQKSGSAS